MTTTCSRGASATPTTGSSTTRPPLVNHAISDHTRRARPTSSSRAPAGLATRRSPTRPRSYARLPHPWPHQVLRLEPARLGARDIKCGFGHSSDTFFYQVAGMLGIDRLGYWAHQYGFGAPTGIDLPGEARGIVPTKQWKEDTFGVPIYPGETYQAGIGQGYVAVTPIQLINAYARSPTAARSTSRRSSDDIVGPDGNVVRPFEPRRSCTSWTSRPTSCGSCASGRAHGRHDPPHLQPRRPADQGRRQVRHGRVRDAGRAGSPAVPLVVRRVRAQGHPTRSSTGPIRSWSCSRSPTTPDDRQRRH